MDDSEIACAIRNFLYVVTGLAAAFIAFHIYSFEMSKLEYIKKMDGMTPQQKVKYLEQNPIPLP